jgi:hypothetical protein
VNSARPSTLRLIDPPRGYKVKTLDLETLITARSAALRMEDPGAPNSLLGHRSCGFRARTILTIVASSE